MTRTKLEHTLKWIMRTILLTLALAGLGYYGLARDRFYRASYAQRSRVGGEWRDQGVTIAVVWPKSEHRERGLEKEKRAAKELPDARDGKGSKADMNTVDLPEPTFLDGVKLAMAEANYLETRQLNQRIRLKIFEEDGEDGSGVSGSAIARQVVEDGNIVAVLGHAISASAIPASVTYESHGILFLTPKSTDPRLTQHGFRYTFRLTPDDHQIAEAMIAFAAQRAWLRGDNKTKAPAPAAALPPVAAETLAAATLVGSEAEGPAEAAIPEKPAQVRVGMYFCRTPGGQSLSEHIIEELAKKGMSLKFARSYLPVEKKWGQMDFRSMIADQSSEEVDVVFVADTLPRGAKVIVDMRRLGVKVPVIASDKMDSGALWDWAGEAANNVYVASAVDPEDKSEQYKAFRNQFERYYKQTPGYSATQGYEALMLLARAILMSDSADPLIVATTIRNTTWKNGLFGEFKFTPAGDIVNRHISIKRLYDGVFTTIPF